VGTRWWHHHYFLEKNSKVLLSLIVGFEINDTYYSTISMDSYLLKKLVMSKSHCKLRFLPKSLGGRGSIIFGENLKRLRYFGFYNFYYIFIFKFSENSHTVGVLCHTLPVCIYLWIASC